MKHVMDYVEMKIPAKPEYVGVIRLTISGIASTMGYTSVSYTHLTLPTICSV